MNKGVSIENIIQAVDLEVLYMPAGGENRQVMSQELNRPGLPLTGFMDFFDAKRTMLIGNTEMSYLATLDKEEKYSRMQRVLREQPPMLIITRGNTPCKEMLQAAEENQVPVLRSHVNTATFTSALFEYLSAELAPMTTEHGVLMEIYGIGVLIRGESGIGKSETAVELIKRGHRLVADDVVEIKRLPDGRLLGMAPDNIRHFMELRGVGITDVRSLFGMSAVKLDEYITLVVNMEVWKRDKQYDRLGMDDEYIQILETDVRMSTIPVRPGRNLATIIEVATMNTRMKIFGYNAAEALNKRLKEDMLNKRKK